MASIPGYGGLAFSGTRETEVVTVLKKWAAQSFTLRGLLVKAVTSGDLSAVHFEQTGDGSRYDSGDKKVYVDLQEPMDEGRNVLNQICETAIFEMQNGVNQPLYQAQLDLRHNMSILEYGVNKGTIESESSITLAKCLIDIRMVNPSPHTETAFGSGHRTAYLANIGDYGTYFINDVHDINETGEKGLITKHMYAYQRFAGYPNTIYKSVLQGGALRGTNVGAMNADQIKDAGEAAWNALKIGGHRPRKDVLPYWLKYLKDKKGTTAMFEWNTGIDISWMDYLDDLQDNGLWANSGTHNTNIAVAVDALL